MDNERYPAPSDLSKPAVIASDQKKDEQRAEPAKKVFICPYKDCGKRFTESGNLKTHIRIHVFIQLHTITNRLVKDLLPALTQDVARALSLKAI